MTKIKIAFCDGSCVSFEKDNPFEEEYKNIINNMWTSLTSDHLVFARDKIVYIREMKETGE